MHICGQFPVKLHYRALHVPIYAVTCTIIIILWPRRIVAAKLRVNCMNEVLGVRRLEPFAMRYVPWHRSGVERAEVGSVRWSALDPYRGNAPPDPTPLQSRATAD